MKYNFAKKASLCLALLGISTQYADAAPELLALSKSAHVMAIVDPATLKTAATVPVGPDPHEVVADPDGNYAYVANTGSGRFHEINVIDLKNRKALTSIDTFPLLGPHGINFRGGKIWFTAQGSKSIGRIDPATQKIDWLMGTGQNQTHMINVSEDQKRIITTNVASSTVSIFNYVTLPPTVTPMGYTLPGAKPYQDWVQKIIPVGKKSEGFAISPDNKRMWTASPDDGTISIIDIQKEKVVEHFKKDILGANRMSFTPDGNRVLISSLRTGFVYVFDAHNYHEIGKIKVGNGGAGILVDPTGKTAFVSCTPDGYIAVIDLDKLVVKGHINIGGRPDGLYWLQ